MPHRQSSPLYPTRLGFDYATRPGVGAIVGVASLQENRLMSNRR
jgi:hypothetical protein